MFSATIKVQKRSRTTQLAQLGVSTIDVKLHFIRGVVRVEEVRLLHVGTAEQHADMLAKPLWRKNFMLHYAALMIIS